MIIYTANQGNSLTFGILFPESYLMGNARNINVQIGGKRFEHTVIDKMVRVDIQSADTIGMYGSKELVLSLDDVATGVRKVNLGQIKFADNTSTFSNQSTNTGYNFTVVLSLDETAITLGDILYDYVKGADGEKGDNGEDAVLPPNIVIDANYVHTDNNYTDADVLEVAKIANKVDKVTGKSLIADTEITRLATVENYDDTNVLNVIAGKEPANANIQQHISATGNPHATKLTDLTNETLTQTTPTDADSVITKVGSAIKASTFSSIYTYIKDKLLAASHTFTQLITFSGGVKTSKILPNSDAAGVVIRNAADTADVAYFDTSNKRVSFYGDRFYLGDINTYLLNEAGGMRYITDRTTLSFYSGGVERFFVQSSNFSASQDNTMSFGFSPTAFRFNRFHIGTGNSTIAGKLIIGGTTTPRSALDVNGGIQMADDTAAASATKAGTKRYREDANNSYIETCMKTGASTYAWIIEKQITW